MKLKQSFLLLFFALLFFSCSDEKKFVRYSTDIKSGGNDSCIVIIGDTQQTSFWEFWREDNSEFTPIILSKIADEEPAMIVHLGDVVFNGASVAQWNEFNEFANPIYSKGIPIFPVPGNHEYYGNNDEALKNYYDHFPVVKNKTWYSKKYKSLLFVFLNSNFDELNESEILNQNKWLNQTVKLAESNDEIRNIIFVTHKPPYTNSTVVNDDENVQKYFVPLFLNSKKSVLFLSGHSHSYEHFIKSGKHFINSGGGGGPRQKLETDTQSPDYHKDQFANTELRKLNYLKLYILPNKLQLEMVGFDKTTKTFSVDDSFILQ